VSVSSRRAVLKGAVVLAALPVAGFTAERRLSPVPKDPFTLGVASGEPAPEGVVIWTRLAPDPLADDGFGGMPARAVDVEREVAADEKFTRVEQRGITTAAPGFAHSVHVELTGLRPADGGDIRDARSCGGVARDVSTADVSTGLQCGTARSWFRLGCPDRNLLHCR
jgi:phosphodiesterase/alkaline phosphatase D-like protein